MLVALRGAVGRWTLGARTGCVAGSRASLFGRCAGRGVLQLEGMLAGYPTNVATDVKTLAHTPAGSFAQHALFLVIAEKRILLQSLAAVNKRLSALR